MKYLLVTLLLIVFVTFGAGFWYWWELQAVASYPRSGWNFSINKNQSGLSILNNLQSAGIIRSSIAARIYLKFSGHEKKMLPGDYQIPLHLSTPQIISLLTAGPKDVKVTIPEGWRREQIATRLKNALSDFDSGSFLRVSQGNEGQLFPDTYLIPAKTDPGTVLTLLLRNFSKKTGFDSVLTGPDRDTLILASLVEREAKTDPDRRLIAGILKKRLAAGWPLQVDASVQYATSTKSCMATPIEVCDWWQTINDTKYPSAYNTYLHPGLPPAPISNPGLASIEAAKNPQTSPYWYYLTGTDGVTYYAKTLEEHHLNISRHLH